MPFDVKSNRDTRFGRLAKCPDCGHGLAKTMPRADEVPDNYRLDQYYTHGASHIPHVPPSFSDRIVIKLAWTFERKVPPTAEFIAEHGGTGSVLDIGAGGGQLLKEFERLGYTVEGVEPDSDAIARGSDSGLVIYEGTAEALPPEVTGKRYDVATMTHVLEHCVAPELALQNVHGVLRDGGLFYCEVPNCGADYFGRYAQISEMLDVPRHLQFFTRNSLETMARAAGFEVAAHRFTGFTRHFSPDWCAWENSIATRLTDRGAAAVPRRTMLGSLSLLATSALAPDDRKYDCLGILFRKR